MSVVRLIVFFTAIVDPPGVALAAAADRRPLAATRWVLATIVAATAAALVAVFADELLDALDVSAETFRIAAGVVVAAGAAVRVANPRAGRDGDAWAATVTPALLAAAVSFAADEGTARAIVGAWIALTFAYLMAAHRPARWLQPMLSRLASGLAIAVGVAMAVDGVLAV
jgi:small neutral amino acid transporter SnatA (MarC family)